MPQMSPLFWVTLFTLFLIMFLFSSIKIYFSSACVMPNNLNKVSINSYKDNKFSWKW